MWQPTTFTVKHPVTLPQRKYILILELIYLIWPKS